MKSFPSSRLFLSHLYLLLIFGTAYYFSQCIRVFIKKTNGSAFGMACILNLFSVWNGSPLNLFLRVFLIYFLFVFSTVFGEKSCSWWRNGIIYHCFNGLIFSLLNWYYFCSHLGGVRLKILKNGRNTLSISRRWRHRWRRLRKK